MAEDIEKRLRVIAGLAGKLEANHVQVDEMMRRMVADGLGAQQYGQFGNGNIPDPTSRAAFTAKRALEDDGIHTREVIVWRDHRPEEDRVVYMASIRAATEALEVADIIRRRYMSANRDLWLRLDETDFCRPHWHYMHTDKDLQKVIPRRGKDMGDLCRECNEFRKEWGRAPDPLEAEQISRGKPPRKLYDPKERRAV